MDSVIIRWEVEDGYVGKSRPQSTSIPRDEWDECVTQEDRDALIEEWVQFDFEQRIRWYINSVDE